MTLTDIDVPARLRRRAITRAPDARLVDIGHVDVAEPSRAGAVLLHLIGQREDAAGISAVGFDHGSL